MAVSALSWAESFDRQPLARLASEPITLSSNWTTDSAPGEIDRRPEIILVDPPKGRYALRWKGRDGKPKELTYYEPDRVQVVVRASMSAGAIRKYRYQYEAVSDRTSGQDVFGVVIQTFDDSVIVTAPSDGRYIGQMTKVVAEFSAGTWYLIPFESGEFPPGTVQRITIESDAAPGLVHVRAHGGPFGMKGVGEEPPGVLEASLPRYEAWPLGLTISPVATVREAEYPFGQRPVGELIQLMADAGWLSGSTKLRYQQLIKDKSPSDLLSAVSEDVDHKKVAPEVAHALSRIVTD